MSSPVTLNFAAANGFCGGSYDTFLAPVRADFDVRVMDRVGHDPAFPVDAGWEQLSRQLEQHLALLPRPLIGMGHSLGGVLTYLVAQRRPEWFHAVVMLDPPLINGVQGWLMRLGRRLGQVDRMVPSLASERRRRAWPDPQSMQDYFSRRPFFQRFDANCLQDYIASSIEADGQGGCRLRFDPAVEAAVFRHTPTSLERMPRLQVPGLLVSGTESDALFRTGARRHVRRQRVTWAEAPGSHMFVLEQPGPAAAPVLEFLAAYGGRR